MLLAVKSLKYFLYTKDIFFISESFALNWYIFVAWTNKKLMLPLQCKLTQNFPFDLEKVIEYRVSAAKVVSSNPCVGLIPTIKKSFVLLSLCTDEHIIINMHRWIP